MKNKVLAFILLITLLQVNISVMADDNNSIVQNDENGQREIVSLDIKQAKKSHKKKLPLIDKIFLDSETAQIIEVNNAEKSQKETVKKIEQEPVIEAFGTPETDGKTLQLQASVQKVPVLSLDDCIKMALENNPTIQASIANTKIYKTKVGQAWSNYFPKIGGSIGYTRNKYLPMFFTPSVSTYNNFAVPTVEAEWLIFDFGKTKAQVDIARKTHESTEENLQETINTTVYNVKDAFYTLLFTIQQEKVWQSSVQQYEISLEQAKAYYDIGVKPKIDVFTAEYNLSNAKLGHIRAQNDIQLAYAQLNNAMGLPEYANYELTEELALKKYDLDMNNLIDEALEVRPGLMAAKKKAQASRYLVKASYRAFLPNVKLTANVTQGGLNPGSGEFGGAIGGNISYPLTNFMLLKKQVDEAHATADKDVADFEVSRQQVYLDVKKAFIQLKNAKENVPVSKNAMKQAEEQYNLARGRYKVGMGDVIELKDAENTYRDAQLKYYKALLDYNLSAAYLEKVVGVPIVSNEEVAL